MGSNVAPILLALLGLVASACAYNYSHDGLDWPGLCASGELQSPINVVRNSAVYTQGITLQLSYEISPKFTLVNTGHTIKMLPKPGSKQKLYYNSQAYNLLQIHAHAVSEHTFDGFFGALEFHYVHQSAANSTELLVISSTLSLDPNDLNNTFVDYYVSNSPTESGANVTVNSPVDLYSLVVKRTVRRKKLVSLKRVVYTYPGSLTTPTCDQVVTWMVIDPADGYTVSVAQMEDFESLIADVAEGDPLSARAPQRLNGRIVRRFSAAF